MDFEHYVRCNKDRGVCCRAASENTHEMVCLVSHCIHEELKRRLNSGNACYHSVHSLLSPGLLSNNIKVKIHTADLSGGAV
jgi:hypothetical protein